MQTTELNRRIAANETELRFLLQKWNIRGRGLDGIREGRIKNGNMWLAKVADILNNNPAGMRSNMEGETDMMGPENYDYGTPETKKDIWETLDKLTGFADKVSDSVLKFRTSINSDVSAPVNAAEYVAPKNNWLLIAAGIAVVVILILIFRK